MLRIHKLAKDLHDIQQGCRSSEEDAATCSPIIDRLRGHDPKFSLADRLALIDGRLSSPSHSGHRFIEAHEALATERERQRAGDQEAQKLIDGSFAAEIAVERRARRHTEARLQQQIQERAMQVCFRRSLVAAKPPRSVLPSDTPSWCCLQVHAAIQRGKSESEERVASEVGELSRLIEAERRERERRLDGLSARHAASVRTLSAEIAREREAREHSASQIIATLDGLLTRTRSELDEERRERQATEQTVLRLLEERGAANLPIRP
jgi:hypothetical protein